MILLRSKGGLGNQVFQIVYALLNSSANEKILIDCSLFSMKFEKDYAGANFLVWKILNSKSKSRMTSFSIGHVPSRIFWKLTNRLANLFKFFNVKLQDGYFSDASLFSSKLDYKSFFDLECDYIKYGIDNDSVIIHVRKGDYTNSVNAQIYYNCESSYFSKAVALIKEKTPNAKFYIMSNDNNWVRENFSFLEKYQILEIDDPILSFKIMTKFSNFIISNSTFSWWPALISQSQNVFVPKRWFLDDKKNINLYPENWIKVEV